ncbi:MAG TPA: Rap1a/Tai family immunity protein [Caulobacteraceae bacterium]|nr:Rap1a/Tai family immunity protein [Caulobacteraceae bacterium]
MVWRSVVLAALVSVSSFAAAPAPAADLEFFTGESLYAQCSAKPTDADFAVRQARCSGYVLGVSDAQQAVQGAGGAGRVCIPPTAGSPQLVEAVVAFLEGHADKRPLAAQDLVLEALSAQYPCK